MWILKIIIETICEGILNGLYIAITAMCGVMSHELYSNGQIMLSVVALLIFTALLNFYHTFKDIIKH